MYLKCMDLVIKKDNSDANMLSFPVHDGLRGQLRGYCPQPLAVKFVSHTHHVRTSANRKKSQLSK